MERTIKVPKPSFREIYKIKFETLAQILGR